MDKAKQTLKNLIMDYGARIESLEAGLKKFRGRYDKPLVTFDLGSNYPLKEKLRKEIMDKGIVLDLWSPAFWKKI